jgi:hypothetical protein
MKLVYVHFWGSESCSGVSHIPFEYDSKEKFVFDVLEKFDSNYWRNPNNWSAKILDDVYLDKDDLDVFEYDIYTLEEWFEKRKEEVKI